MPSTRRRCTKCKKVKAESSFSRDKSRSSGFFPWCKPCQQKSTAQFQSETDELNGHICPVDDVPIRGHRNRRFCSQTCKNKASSLRKKYNLTVGEYRRMVEFLDDRCPICLQRPTSWQVDHDHKSLKVTGPVCINCNVGLLAYSGHDPDRAQRLADYLREPTAMKLGINKRAPEGATPPSQLHNRWKFKSPKRST